MSSVKKHGAGGSIWNSLWDKESCRQRATSWFPGCDSMAHGGAYKGATGLHAGPWQQELLCLAQPPQLSAASTCIQKSPCYCQPSSSRAFLSVTQAYINNSFLICFLLATDVHVGIQAQIPHTAFLWVREATCIHLHNPFRSLGLQRHESG